jgi:subtilisin family serine protease
MNYSLPQLPETFAGLTGRGVRVAMIDSGVNPAHPHVAGVADGVGITASGEDADYLDYIGHGTAVAGAIREKAPEALLYAVKVFDQTLTTSLEIIIRAIEWAIDQDIQLINLSLGTLNPKHRERFEQVVAAAAARGSVIIAACEIGGLPSLPGCLPAVIGVGPDWNCPRHSYRCVMNDGQTTFLASGYARPVPGVPPERNLNGISFAVAHLTGFAALARQQCHKPDLAELLSILTAGAAF